MYDIVGKKRWYFLFSALITIPGLIFVLLGGLKPTIDFTGGTVWEIRYASNPTPQAVQQELVVLGHPEAQVTRLGDGYLRIRTSPVDLLPAATAAPTASLAPATPSAAASTSASASTTAKPSPTASASASAAVSAPSASPAVVPGTPFDDLEKALIKRFGAPQGGGPRSVTTVGPIIGSDLIRSSAILINRSSLLRP